MAAEVAVELAVAAVKSAKSRLGREWKAAWHEDLVTAEFQLDEALRVLTR